MSSKVKNLNSLMPGDLLKCCLNQCLLLRIPLESMLAKCHKILVELWDKY